MNEGEAYTIIYHHSFYGTCRVDEEEYPFPTLKMAEIYAKGLVEEYKQNLVWWRIYKITTEEISSYDQRTY